MDIKALKELAKCAINGTTPEASTEFDCSINDVEETLRANIKSLASDYNTYRRNKYDIFEIMQEAADEYLPNRIIQAMGQFAEVRTFNHGDKVEFKVRKGKLRGKKFVTAASPAGVYEAFRLDSKIIPMNTTAVGGATTIDFNRYLCGDEDLAENMSVLYEGIEDRIYEMVQEALIATITSDESAVLTANYCVADEFVASSMLKLINTVRAYGTGAVIYATRNFISAMGPDAYTVGTTTKISKEDMSAIHDDGIINVFRGTPIVEIPQSFVDETNSEHVINDQYAYIFPTGGEKVVKVGLEGNTVVDEAKNRDGSFELNAWKKVGVSILHTNQWCIYRNTSL